MKRLFYFSIMIQLVMVTCSRAEISPSARRYISVSPSDRRYCDQVAKLARETADRVGYYPIGLREFMIKEQEDMCLQEKWLQAGFPGYSYELIESIRQRTGPAYCK